MPYVHRGQRLQRRGSDCLRRKYPNPRRQRMVPDPHPCLRCGGAVQAHPTAPCVRGGSERRNRSVVCSTATGTAGDNHPGAAAMTSTLIVKFPFDRPSPTALSPVLSQVRSSCPVAQMQLPSGHMTWLVTGYEDVKQVLA